MTLPKKRKKPGGPAKSSKITDSVTPKLLSEYEKKMLRVADRRPKKTPEKPPESENKKEGIDIIDILDDGKVLGDLWAMYEELGGKTRLLEVARTDNEFFKKIVVKLLDLEYKKAEKLAARREGSGDGESDAVLVVLKGLDHEQQISKTDTGGINMRSLAAVLSPDGSVYAEDEEAPS